MAFPACYTPRLVSLTDKLADDRVKIMIFPYCFAKADSLNAFMGAQLPLGAQSKYLNFQ
jgi:hypothetical protein